MGRKHKTHPAETGYQSSAEQGFQHPQHEPFQRPPSYQDIQYEDDDGGHMMNHDYGESYHLSQSSPIAKKRSCTDILCVILLLAFIGCWIFVAYLGYRDSDINRVIYPTDTEGNICGMKHMKSRPNLLLFDITQCLNPAALISGCPTPHVCVSHCPDETFSAYGSLEAGVAEHSIKDRIFPYCNVQNRSDLDGRSVKQLIQDEICPPWYITSSSLFGRCFPSSSNNSVTTNEKIIRAQDNPNKEAINQMMLQQALYRLTSYLNIREVGERIFSDLAETWWMIGISLIGACVLSFIWIVLMRFLAGLMVWLSISIILFGTGGLLAFCSYKLYLIWTNPTDDSMKNILEVSYTPEYINDLLELRDTWLAFTIILGVVFFIIVCVFIYLRQRISIAINLIEEGSKAVASICSSLFFPFIPFVLQLCVTCCFLLVAMYLASSGQSDYRVYFKDEKCLNVECEQFNSNDTCTTESFSSCAQVCPHSHCQFVKYTKNSDFSWLQLVNVFGLYWGLFFFSAYAELVLAAVFSRWYWTDTEKGEKIPGCLLVRSMGLAFYHVGTIAFGSLILAIIRFIRTILEYIERKCKNFNNDLVRCVMCMCKCCLWCLDKIMRFLNKNIYIMCAMKGTNFWTSGQEAFNLIMRNLVRVVVLDGVCDFLIFLGKLVIVLISGTLSYFFFGRYIPEIQEHIPNLNYMFTPIVFIVIGSYLIASAFFGVYSMAVDTLFLCFLEDLERNDGTPGREYYMSKSLKKILGKMAKNAEQYRMAEHHPSTRKQP